MAEESKVVNLFGSTIKETGNAFKGMHFEGTRQVTATAEDKTKAIGRIVVSILLIFLATYLFTSGNQTTGGTIVGALTGYWIK